MPAASLPLLLLSLALPALLPVASAVPEPSLGRSAQVRDDTQTIAELLAELAAAVAKKGKQDARAVEIVEELTLLFKLSGPKDRAAIVKGIAAAVRSPRPRPDKTSFDDRLASIGTRALGTFGEPACAALIDLLGERELRKNPAQLERMLEALGRTRDKKGVPVLVDHVARRDVAAARGAANGLIHFEGADGKTRKTGFEPAFKTLIAIHDELVRAYGTAEADPNGYWQDISPPLLDALKALSRQEGRGVMAWQTWWNDHKNADWDKLE